MGQPLHIGKLIVGPFTHPTQYIITIILTIATITTIGGIVINKIIRGNILELQGYDSIVNPANGMGIMGAGLAGAIAKAIGHNAYKTNYQQVCEGQRFTAGKLYEFTEMGNLKNFHSIINLVTMEMPGGYTDYDIIEKCCNSLVDYQSNLTKMRRVVMPGLGIGIGRLDIKTVAYIMVNKLKSLMDRNVVSICDRNSQFINYCQDIYVYGRIRE